MRVTMLVLLFLILTTTIPIRAQVPDTRILYLTSRILEKLPDAGYTRDALGTTAEREIKAIEHASAIVSASDQYKEEWEDFVELGQWTEFRPEHDLPALIAAIAFRESSLRPIVRLDDNSVHRKIPRGVSRADLGVLQVRAPSLPAKNCGVKDKADLVRLVEDLEYSYLVGTCVLTRHIARYIQLYQSPAYTRLHWSERPNIELLFYGVTGRRKGTPGAKLARELMVIERYNWGESDLYLNNIHGGYARKIIGEFEFFRVPHLEEDAS